MDLGPRADGELLQRALDGEPVAEPGILAARRRAPRRPVGRAGGPRPARRVRLRPAGPAARRRRGRRRARRLGRPPRPFRAEGDQPGTGGTVSVLRVAARPLKMIAAAAASILVVGGALGVRVPLGGARRRALRRQAAARPRRGPARRLALRPGPDLPRPGAGAHRRGARPHRPWATPRRTTSTRPTTRRPTPPAAPRRSSWRSTGPSSAPRP